MAKVKIIKVEDEDPYDLPPVYEQRFVSYYYWPDIFSRLINRRLYGRWLLIDISWLRQPTSDGKGSFLAYKLKWIRVPKGVRSEGVSWWDLLRWAWFRYRLTINID